MLDCTDRHYRYLARLLTKHSMLYTEMITTGALIHGDHERLLKIDPCEHPVALQLGGSDSSAMARCAEYADEFNYDEVNINVGCPSDKVQAGKFGACLMLEPNIVAACIKAMKTVTKLEITVKTRIGVDDQDSYEHLHHFVETVAAAGCATVIVHARKAYLSGLSPKENRTVPPLCYKYVYKIKQDFPRLKIILNGGLNNIKEIQEHLSLLDGVMVGREAYDNPFFLADVDQTIFNDFTKPFSRHKILQMYKPYMQSQFDNGVPLKVLVRHALGLFNGLPGAKAWRRYLSAHAHKKGADIDVINQAENLVATIQEMALAG